MNKYILILTILINFNQLLKSQEVLNKNVIKNSVSVKKTISNKTLFEKKAEKLYDELSFASAVEYYEVLNKKNDPSGYNSRCLAECYYKLYDFKNAELAYKNLNTKFSNEINEIDLINYFQCSKYNENYIEADKTLDIISKKRNDNIIYKNHKKNSSYYIELKKDSTNYKIINLKSINSEYSEFSPVLLKNKNEMIYASNRRNTGLKNKTFSWDDSYFMDLYSSQKKDSLLFNSTKPMEKKVVGNFHDGPISISNDEKTIYLTKSNILLKKKSGKSLSVINLKLYIIKRDLDGKLNEPENFPYNSDDYSLGHAVVSKDGNRLYFVSDMPGGFGQTDLYYSDNENGKWSEPKNLGPEINSEGREMFPYIHEDGTLFYSTDGKAGLGGLDLYFTTPNSNTFSEPKNLGYPINTHYDDFGFSLNKDIKTGYFSSNRSGGEGKDDIYFFRSKKNLIGSLLKGFLYDLSNKEIVSNVKVYLLDTNKTVLDSIITNEKGEYSFNSINPSQDYIVTTSILPKYYKEDILISKLKSGENTFNIGLNPKYKLICTVKDAKTKDLIGNVKATIIDQSNQNSKSYETDSLGTFIDFLKDRKTGELLQFTIKYEKQNYITIEKKYNFKLDVNTKIEINEDLQILEIGTDIAKIIQINPIYFDLAKFNIRADAAKELDKIVKVMQENPTMTIELRSHTDCRSSKAYNLSLSDKRAKSSANYIVSKGIPKNRIIGKGYGESILINGCECEGPTKSTCSEAEHQANRRTEFLITKF
jgi:outer membrane protein OmpA-like peptidoglycan-associated protein